MGTVTAKKNIDEKPVMALSEAAVIAAEVADGVLTSRVVRGSVVLLTSTGLVAATNLVYNIVIARMLGAAGFGDATAIYTLLMLTSALTLSFQLVCSKLVARSLDVSGKAAVYSRLLRRAWQVGGALGILLVVGSPYVATYLRLPAKSDIVLLAIATTIYIPLGVRRGRIQGCYEFRRLASNVVVEVMVKFGAALLLVHYGLGVTGVVAGIMLSIAAAYLAATPDSNYRLASLIGDAAPIREGVQAGVFFVGQAILSNLDILLVKHFFPSTVAGVYAGVALVGRVVYMLSWSVVSSMFPVSAGSAREDAGKSVLRTGLLLVSVVTTAFIAVVWAAPNTLWTAILGKRFLLPGEPFSSLLTLYAVMTGIYSIAVVLMTYEMSRRIGNAGWVQLATAALLPAGIILFHGSLIEVILVQLVLMAGLFLVVSIPLLTGERPGVEVAAPIVFGPLNRVRRVTDDEIVAAFLRGEFYHREFDHYRAEFQHLVDQVDLTNERENAMRRALLFLRRGKLWREIPPDTEWWEVELDRQDLARVRAFPRNDWRRFAENNFLLAEMVSRIRARIEAEAQDRFLDKIRSVAADLSSGRIPDAVLLIGVDDLGPLTIIEGNHRMTAAMLMTPEAAHRRFRFYCGLSPQMTSCCWYQTDFASLLRYARNRLRYLFHDVDYFVSRTLRRRLAEEDPG